ncbi:MAG TPA: hypothetical protein VEA80_04890 [Vitreimonas sp.]|uniref:hypothetical protein n=1 Tax=Vitreimonas sp. TaxID=3069702 RepID=UPI002D31FF41|nr:hypothetical protein [Vitreimonas sp.]HYD86788.1 hypothetical protein [Vitreimonas sp.]
MSSWREVARRVLREREAPPAPERACADDRDDYAQEERAAIAQHEGGLPQSWAVALAAIERGPRPHGVSERDWRAFVNVAWERADAFGAELAANGWTFEEVFGVGEHWARLDRRGACWLARDARIVEVTPERIVFERGGDRTTHNRGRPH